jgi:hypothetical protein
MRQYVQETSGIRFGRTDPWGRVRKSGDGSFFNRCYAAILAGIAQTICRNLKIVFLLCYFPEKPAIHAPLKLHGMTSLNFTEAECTRNGPAITSSIYSAVDSITHAVDRSGANTMQFREFSTGLPFTPHVLPAIDFWICPHHHLLRIDDPSEAQIKRIISDLIITSFYTTIYSLKVNRSEGSFSSLNLAVATCSPRKNLLPIYGGVQYG